MNLLIFDLDGTLIDSKLDLANSVNAMLTRWGIPWLPNEVVFSYVGNGAPTLIRRALGAAPAESEVESALKYFLAHYGEHLLENTRLYPGVKESLDRFRDAGQSMAVLTNKPLRFLRPLVDGLGLGGYFFQAYGGDSFPEKKPHPMGVEKLLKESGAARDESLMIGDSAVDILTARKAGIKAAGVTYGFQPESLERHPPDILVGSMPELAALLLDNAAREPKP